MIVPQRCGDVFFVGITASEYCGLSAVVVLLLYFVLVAVLGQRTTVAVLCIAAVKAVGASSDGELVHSSSVVATTTPPFPAEPSDPTATLFVFEHHPHLSLIFPSAVIIIISPVIKY